MTTQTEPELPEPAGYYYEWDDPYGKRKFSAAPHNGRQCDRAVAYYTADQIRAAITADRAKRFVGPVLPEPANVSTAPSCLNTGDKAMWALGWNECLAKLKEPSCKQ